MNDVDHFPVVLATCIQSWVNDVGSFSCSVGNVCPELGERGRSFSCSVGKVCLQLDE